jgi:alpha-amylase
VTEPAPPTRFLFGLHLHQPVGNFDHVLEQHVAEVYEPLLDLLERRSLFPVTFHVSGPLIEWLEHHSPAYLDRLGRLVSDGRIELLAAGWTEPILAALLRPDRVEQVERMREELSRRFGVNPRGVWLTERVWVPDVASDLCEAGIEFAIVDDRHFLISGFAREQLHSPWETEAEHRRLALFAIDERLRYLVPFRPTEEFGAYLRSLHARAAPLAVLADDGEKFGGWPGTYDWVYTRGWLDRFADELETLQSDGVLALSTFSSAVDSVPTAGLAYLPDASYREMESWSSPPATALRLQELESRLGERQMESGASVLLRGTHWRNFLAKYSESNRLHKKAQWLSLLCRKRGNPGDVRGAIARAQCNDAYWHGVFGGLYLPHLRAALWRELAAAEGLLRAGEMLEVEQLDFDFDGRDELWIHSEEVSVLLSPARGGAVEEWTRFSEGRNLLDVLTRRWEAYHEEALHGRADHHSTEGGAPSIHDLEHALRLEQRPAVDLDDRAMLQERVLGGDVTRDAWASASYQPSVSWTRIPFGFDVKQTGEQASVVFHSPDDTPSLAKEIQVSAVGVIGATYRWEISGGGWFTAELTLSGEIAMEHDAEEVWTAPVETVSKSERGMELTRQGDAVLLRWPLSRGAGSVRLG